MVVIGAQSEADHWFVLGRKLWGYELQAQYIDALLSGGCRRAAPGYLPILLFLGFLIVLEALPFFIRYRYRRKKRREPDFWKDDLRWLVILSVSFLLSMTLAFFFLGYLPPLLMLFAVLFILSSCLTFAGFEQSKKMILPEEPVSRRRTR